MSGRQEQAENGVERLLARRMAKVIGKNDDAEWMAYWVDGLVDGDGETARRVLVKALQLFARQ